MRMSRVNITMPDNLYLEAKRVGLNISQVAQRAVAADIARATKVAELDAYLAELEAELGPTGDGDRDAARSWADRLLGPAGGRRTA